MRRKESPKIKKIKRRNLDGNYIDPNFAFIAGYTPGGVPYRLTHEEIEEMKENVKKSNFK